MKHRSDSAEPDRPGPTPPSGADLAPTDAEMLRLRGDVDSALAREHGVRAWLRALPTWCRVLIAAASVVAMIAAVSGLIPRGGDFQHYGALRLWVTMSAYGVLLAVLMMEALHPLHRIEAQPGPVVALGALALFAPFVLALWPYETRGVVIEPPHDCMLIGLLVGSALIAVLRALDRSAVTREARSIVVAAAAAGTAANLALLFHCAEQRPLHLLIGHAMLGVLLWAGYRKLAARLTARAQRESV